MIQVFNLGNRIVNNWLYKGPDGWVLIDTGYDTGFDRCLKGLKGRGLTFQDIRYVFLTHAHDDHAGFLGRLLQEAPNARAVISPLSVETLLRGQNSFEGGCSTPGASAFCHFMKLLRRGEHLFPPLTETDISGCLIVDESNKSELETLLGGKIILTPGHTADSMSLLLPDGTLFCGDAAMNGFPSSHRITIWVGDKDQFIDSWKTILAANPRSIYPGHGKPFPPEDLRKYRAAARKMELYPLKP